MRVTMVHLFSYGAWGRVGDMKVSRRLVSHQQCALHPHSTHTSISTTSCMNYLLEEFAGGSQASSATPQGLTLWFRAADRHDGTWMSSDQSKGECRNSGHPRLSESLALFSVSRPGTTCLDPKALLPLFQLFCSGGDPLPHGTGRITTWRR